MLLTEIHKNRPYLFVLTSFNFLDSTKSKKSSFVQKYLNFLCIVLVVNSFKKSNFFQKKKKNSFQQFLTISIAGKKSQRSLNQFMKNIENLTNFLAKQF